MPLLESKTVAKGVLDLVISVPVDDLTPFLEKSAQELQTKKPLPGFRPGKASLDQVRQHFGAMPLLEGSLKFVLPWAYADILKREHFHTLGEPEFQVLKVSPAQPIEFSVKVALLPEVKLSDYKKLREVRKPIEIPESDVDEVVDELREMRSTQTAVDRIASNDDRVIIDLTMSLDDVPLDGGVAKDHAIDLFKPYVVPGFAEQLIGLKKGDTKKFTLPFPKEHYDKRIAGRDVGYNVTVKEVREWKRPDVDEAFVKTVGKFDTVEQLRGQLKENLSQMHAAREEQRLERVIIDKIIAETTFGELPDLLVNAELQKVFWRLRSQVENEGGTWEDYLEHLKKTPEDLAKELIPEAITRVKASLVVQTIADQENISATDEEVEAERLLILAHYPKDEDEEIREQVRSSEYDKHIKHLLMTRKVMQKLKNIATTETTK